MLLRRVTSKAWAVGLITAAGATLVTTSCQGNGSMSDLNSGVISGVVESSAGPEAGVWVIAETSETGTKLRKIVVTNEAGRFLLPELPDASYAVWVRGYGLVESDPITATPDQDILLTVEVAGTPQLAAQSYPADYWLSLIDLPEASEFPGTGPEGNGINPNLTTQDEWINNLKYCNRCHQLGNLPTRTIPDIDSFESSVAAWEDRVQRGQRGGSMSSRMFAFGQQRGLEMFADWTDRIAAGEVPEAPPRPTGVERNIVLTVWDWADNVAFMHDVIASDKRNPVINEYGAIYGADLGNDFLTIVDPIAHTEEKVKVPLKVDSEPVPSMFTQAGFRPYRYFGEEPVWDNPANPHNPMMDDAGRVWLTTRVRENANPDWCLEGSDHPSAQYFPKNRAGRHAGYYDPATGEFVLIGTCFGTHHLQFAEDEDNTIWFSGDSQVIGWLNTRIWDLTQDERAAQGWCPNVSDTNGDGMITRPWNEPRDPVDPTRDTQHTGFPYGIIVNPVDGSVWWVTGDEYPGRLMRLDPGDNPPESCTTEFYEVPKERGFRTRGIDADRNGVLWMALAGSSHLASFDRSKCEGPLNGPETIGGRHCDEGWTLYPVPGPKFEGTEDLGTDFQYYNFVDQFNTLGLGENVPIVTGSGSNSLKALIPETGEWVVLRVPYPQGFYSRGMDGRIDDPDGGWKGRGIYTTSGADAAWHIEGGPQQSGVLVKFQIRPDPLAN